MALNLAWPRKDIYNATEPFHWYLQYGAILFIGVVFFGGLAYYWFVQRHKTGVLESHRLAPPGGPARPAPPAPRSYGPRGGGRRGARPPGDHPPAAGGAGGRGGGGGGGGGGAARDRGGERGLPRPGPRAPASSAPRSCTAWPTRASAARDELARVLTLDQGKPLKAEAEVEVGELIEFFRMAAEDGKRVEGTIPESAAPGRRVLLLRRPLGVLGLITPWNWPYTMPAEVLAPALACGNCVVWTPAPSTAVCSGVLAECVAEADLPPGVFNFVLGPGPEVGDELAANPGTRAVAFTGSTATGLTVARRAAGKAQLLEMGGNGPFVVLDDADLAAAAEAARVGCFLGAGQSCSAAERLLVHEAVREEFVALLAGRWSARCASATRSTTRPRWARSTTSPAPAKMDEHVADAVERGADGGHRRQRARTASRRASTGSRRCSTACPPDSIAVTQETFGPIAPIVGIGSLEEAIEQTNAQTYGLMAAIFTATSQPGCATPTRCTWAS